MSNFFISRQFGGYAMDQDECIHQYEHYLMARCDQLFDLKSITGSAIVSLKTPRFLVSLFEETGSVIAFVCNLRRALTLLLLSCKVWRRSD